MMIQIFAKSHNLEFFLTSCPTESGNVVGIQKFDFMVDEGIKGPLYPLRDKEEGRQRRRKFRC